MKKSLTLATLAAFGLAALGAADARAETLRLLTWGSYAPENVIELFEAAHPDVQVEVTFSNNEDMIAKLRATGGAGFDLAQPSHDRVFAAQLEYNIYKPLDLSKINTEALDPSLLDGTKANTTIDGEVYSIPHQWGTSGLMADITKAPDIKSWADLCDPKYKGRTSMRLRRTILLGTAFAAGHDPFAAYADLEKYQEILDEAEAKLIACKDNIKAYWKGGDDLSSLMLSGEVIASETWDSTAYRLYSQNPQHRLRSAGDRGAGLDRHLHAAAEGQGRRGRVQVDQFRPAARDRHHDVGPLGRDRRGAGRRRPHAGRQARGRAGGVLRRGHREPPVLRQHPARRRGHGRQDP